jgi:hypothetical protein
MSTTACTHALLLCCAHGTILMYLVIAAHPDFQLRPSPSMPPAHLGVRGCNTANARPRVLPQIACRPQSSTSIEALKRQRKKKKKKKKKNENKKKDWRVPSLLHASLPFTIIIMVFDIIILVVVIQVHPLLIYRN